MAAAAALAGEPGTAALVDILGEERHSGGEGWTAVWGGRTGWEDVGVGGCGRTGWEDGGVATAFGGARRIEGKELLQSCRAWDGVLISTQHWHYNVIVVVWAGAAGGHLLQLRTCQSTIGLLDVSVDH